MPTEREIQPEDHVTWSDWPMKRLKIKKIIAHTIVSERQCMCGCGNMLEEGRRLIMYAQLKDKCRCGEFLKVWVPAHEILEKPCLKTYVKNTRLERILQRDV